MEAVNQIDSVLSICFLSRSHAPLVTVIPRAVCVRENPTDSALINQFGVHDFDVHLHQFGSGFSRVHLISSYR